MFKGRKEAQLLGKIDTCFSILPSNSVFVPFSSFVVQQGLKSGEPVLLCRCSQDSPLFVPVKY